MIKAMRCHIGTAPHVLLLVCGATFADKLGPKSRFYISFVARVTIVIIHESRILFFS